MYCVHIIMYTNTTVDTFHFHILTKLDGLVKVCIYLWKVRKINAYYFWISLPLFCPMTYYIALLCHFVLYAWFLLLPYFFLLQWTKASDPILPLGSQYISLFFSLPLYFFPLLSYYLFSPFIWVIFFKIIIIIIILHFPLFTYL